MGSTWKSGRTLEDCPEEAKSARSLKENGGDEEGHSSRQGRAYSSSEPWDLPDTRPKFREMRRGAYYLPELGPFVAV